MSLTFLPNLAAFRIKGPTTKKFLQGQLTCDINALKPGQNLRGAHCNKEGRVMALYDLIERQDEVILITQKDLLKEAMKDLQHYGMFSKLTWQDLTDKEFIYADENGNLQISSEKISAADQNENFYYYQQILHQQAFLTSKTVGKFLPQELGLNEPALSFTKGCYLGQEVVARVHYLGKLKRELQIIIGETALAPLEELFSDGKSVGEIVVSVLYQECSYGLALINVSCAAKEFFLASGVQVLPYGG
jgi:tRNA-modifying protein YgfZ